MFKRSPEVNPLKKFQLNFNSLSDAELEKHILADIETAASKTSANNELPVSRVPAVKMGVINSTQNWVIIRQNELLRRQNEKIIQLLQQVPTNSNALDAATNANDNQGVASIAEHDDSRFFS